LTNSEAQGVEKKTGEAVRKAEKNSVEGAYFLVLVENGMENQWMARVYEPNLIVRETS